jgi:hypothetical protein
MARTARKKAGGKGQASAEVEAKSEYDNLSGQPPPPPEIDPAATSAGYPTYGGQGADYGSPPPGTRASPSHASRAYFPTAAGPTSGGEYGDDQASHHVQHLPPLNEAIHPEDSHHYAPPTGYEASAHHSDPSHAPYDQGSNNFFDPQIIDQAPPSSGRSNGNGGNNHFNGNIMTPPPGSQGHYGSSPYQVGHQSAPQVFHRASISGPVMHSHYPPPPGTPTPNTHQQAPGAPHANDMAAWGTPSGSARPHTADGMFNSQMGGLPSQWAAGANMSGGPDYNRNQRGSVGSLASLPDAQQQHGSSSGKVFSYMPNNGDDTSSVDGSESQSGSGPKKRPRRRYDEIERLYPCAWAGCQKSYGTLNHLNAHVAMQKHGAKRSPGEFKDMRKAWRKSKREDEQRRQANQAAANEENLTRGKMMFQAPNQPFMTHGGYPVNSFGPPPPHVMPPPGQVPRYSMHQQQAPMYGNQGGYSHVPVDAQGRPYSSVHQAPQQQVGGQGGSSGLGAYLMAHRGSI